MSLSCRYSASYGASSASVRKLSLPCYHSLLTRRAEPNPQPRSPQPERPDDHRPLPRPPRALRVHDDPRDHQHPLPPVQHPLRRRHVQGLTLVLRRIRRDARFPRRRRQGLLARAGVRLHCRAHCQRSPFPRASCRRDRAWLTYSTVFVCICVRLTQITLGDAIVCWRACVVWHKRRAVAAACSALVCATFGKYAPLPLLILLLLFKYQELKLYTAALGVAATALSCDAHQRGLYAQCAVMFTTGVMYERFPAGIAACALSLVTNVFTTGLVGYKAWCVCASPGLPPLFSQPLIRVACLHCVAGSRGRGYGDTSSRARARRRSRSCSRSSWSRAPCILLCGYVSSRLLGVARRAQRGDIEG